MGITQQIVSKALELRNLNQIPVRQVLSTMKVKGVRLENSFLELIATAVNVKSVKVIKTSVSELEIILDTRITPALKREGIVRKMIRFINNTRKKLQMSPDQAINLYIWTEDGEIIQSIIQYQKQILNAIQAKNLYINSINPEDNFHFNIDGSVVKIHLESLK